MQKGKRNAIRYEYIYNVLYLLEWDYCALDLILICLYSTELYAIYTFDNISYVCWSRCLLQWLEFMSIHQQELHILIGICHFHRSMWFMTIYSSVGHNLCGYSRGGIQQCLSLAISCKINKFLFSRFLLRVQKITINNTVYIQFSIWDLIWSAFVSIIVRYSLVSKFWGASVRISVDMCLCVLQ